MKILTCKFSKVFLTLGLLIIHSAIYSQAPLPGKYEVMGLGGAGGMYTPSMSPSDSGLMFVSCDMSGSYRSLDYGKSWQMIHSEQINSSRACRPMFVGDSIYWIKEGELRVSTDKGENWVRVPAGQAPWSNNVTRLSHIPGAPPILFAGAANKVYVSINGGQTWTTGVTGTGDIKGLTAAGEDVFAAIGSQIWKSPDSGTTWSSITVPEAENQSITSMASGISGDNKIVYATAGSKGLLRSTDNGGTWVKVLAKTDVLADGTVVGTDLIDILMPVNQVNVAYVNNQYQVFKTIDGGATWQSIFRMDSYSNPGTSTLPFNVEKSWVQTELKWGYYITELGMGINPGDPDVALVSTQGDLYLTTDGGISWKQKMNERLGVLPGDPGTRYKSIGLEVTSSWNFYFDPFDPNRYFISYTDIGFARSVDKGNTWIHSAAGSGNWGNTFYNVAFDPAISGKMFAAASNRHDIPHWTHVSANSSQHEGGVVKSTNHGLSWVRLNTGLPKVPCTWVALDPTSPADNRTLYAAMYGEGVYKSVDDGKNWVKKSNGLGNTGNMHVLQVQIHPKTGNLFAGITAKRDNNVFPVAGGLWKSTDGGENWTNLTATLNLKWPTYFTFHPEDENIIYLSASTAPGAAQGGLYKTTNGGQSWNRILYDADFAKKTSPSYVHAMGVKLHPVFPDLVYLGSTHGLWVSTDAGENWVWFNEIPFKGAQNVAFDPESPKTMYVNTFGGGVWKGFYLPSDYEEPITGMDEIKGPENDFKIYPNPNNGNFTLALNGSNEKVIVHIFNNNGNRIYEKEIFLPGEKRHTISLNQQASGIYHIRIIKPNHILSKSFIIK